MDIEKLRSFIAVAHHGSISAAADELYLSASAVSKHIAALERELGTNLFRRTQKKLLLNRDGEKCLVHAEKIVAEYSNMVASICVREHIELISIPSQIFITEPLTVFSRLQPNISFSIIDRHGPEIIRALKSREYQLGFAGSPYVDPDCFDSIPITWSSIGVVLPDTHPMASLPSISVTRLKNEKFYFMSPQTGLYDFYFGICMEHGFTPHVDGIRSREDTIMSLVRSGGATFMTEGSFSRFPNTGLVFIPLEEEYYGGTSLIKLKGIPLSRNAQCIWNFFAESVSNSPASL